MMVRHIPRWFAAALACSVLLLPAALPAAETAAAYRQGQASPDGIGKFYMGREIAHVMGWQGASWLERPERAQEERTDLLLPELGLREGMVVADIGAGTGYMSRRMAAQVGASGKVFAVDVQPEMVRMLIRLASMPGVTNIFPLLGAKDDVPLPAGTVDLAIMVNVYHELEFPREMLAGIVRALKPGGRVVFVEYRAEDPSVPIKPLHKMSQEQVKREAGQQDLTWERTADGLPWQHVLIFRKS